MSVSVSATNSAFEPVTRVLARRDLRDATPQCGHTADHPISSGGIRSQPVIVDGCFGWLHEPSAPGDTAVLLCPALGWDGLHAHYGFRRLGDELAAAGYPALRLQYPGTGNSRDLAPGPDGDPAHWQAWQDSVHAAADWLLARTGARRLVLVGLRFGAMLATTVAAQRMDVEALALVAPVLRGKSYMRQLDMEARLESGAAAQAGEGLEFHELRLSQRTVEQISAVDLRQAKLRAGVAVAIFPQAPSQLLDGCVQAWTQAGVRVTCGRFDGLDPLLQEAIHSDPAPPVFTSVLDWLRGAVPPGPGPSAARAALGRSVLELPDATETALSFGEEGRLFGILCRPARQAGGRVVIIGNTGRDPHYGIARFGVELARKLAASGIASFRIDFAGLGDSLAPAHAPDGLSPLFDLDRTADISAAIDALEGLGFDDFAVQGLCSGAYHAYVAASRDRRIATLLLVNLPIFQWQGGDSVKEAMWKSAPPGRLLGKLADREAWARAVHGGTDFIGLARVFAGRALRAVLGGLGGRFAPDQPGAAKDPAETMAALAARRVSMLLLFSEGDPGLDPLGVAFGRDGEALRAVEGVDLRIVPGIDHVLSGRTMREKAAHHLVSFLAA